MNILKLIFAFFLINIYNISGQSKAEYGELLGLTYDSCKVYFDGSKHIAVDPITNKILPIRVDEYNFKTDIVKLSNGMLVDYDNELGHYAFFDINGNQVSKYLYRQIFFYKNTIATFRLEFIPNETNAFKKNRYFLEFLDFKLNPTTNKRIFDIAGGQGNKFIYNEGLIGFETLKFTKSFNMNKGFMDFKGNVIIQPTFLQIDNFKNGIAAVLGKDENNRIR